MLRELAPAARGVITQPTTFVPISVCIYMSVSLRHLALPTQKVC